MKIAYIMLTNGLEYDDRIRKEMFSMRKLLGENIEFKIFGFHGDNHAEVGILSYGVPYELVSLKNRGGNKGVIAELRKEYDFFSQIKPKVNDYDVLWCCDHQPFFFPLFSKQPVIWDLHEIPGSLITTWYKKLLFHRMERRSKWLIHANQERIDYLKGQGVLRHPEKNLILRNYPDQSWLSESAKPATSFEKFQTWLNGEDYIYIQGINGPGRYPWETLSAVMEAKAIKAVVIGNVPTVFKKKVADTYPDADKYIYYTGQIVQAETAAFIAHCKFSMVFYKIDRPNNRYCEPNRMFQSLGLGRPVIAGRNEPMANVVAQYGNGIVLSSDGGNVAENVEGIKRMIENYAELTAKAELVRDRFFWESQEDVFRKLLGTTKE